MSRLAFRLAVGAALVGVLACGSTDDTTPIALNFNRPIDIGFACYGGLRLTGGGSSDINQTVVSSAMPTPACDFRSQLVTGSDSAPVPLGQEQIDGGTVIQPVSWFGFVLQSEPGTVGLLRWDTKPASSFIGGDVQILDADPLTPGQNGISVGENPTAIATSKDGCYEIVTNGGSCDVSELDITSALKLSPPARVNRVDVTNASGVPIHARAAAMISEPGAGVIGNACGDTPTGKVFIAYPSCHLVAEVDLATSQIVQGVSYASGAPVLVDGNVTCPDECAGDAVTAGIRPVTLDLNDDTRTGFVARRLAIGADNSSSATIVELDTTTSAMQSVSQIAFQDLTRDKSLGITSIAMSPHIGMGGDSFSLNDADSTAQFQFIYAVATDSTVRVADIFTINGECDAEVDPRLIFNNQDIKQMSCFPVGDPKTPRRRPGARGPGVELPRLTGADAVPMSVAIFGVDTYSGDPRPALLVQPSTLIGYFAFVTATNGATFIINIDDDTYGDTVIPSEPFLTQTPLAIAHQVRDGFPDRDEHDIVHNVCDTEGPDPNASSGNEADPRSPLPPARGIASGTIAQQKALALPYIHQGLCTGADDIKPVTDVEFALGVDVTNGSAATETSSETARSLVFPDLRGLRSDETWTLTYQGSLSNDDATQAIDGPGIRTGQLLIENADGMDLVDYTKPFCDAGVEAFDIVQLRGCDPANGSTDCPDGDVCFVHPDSTVAGLGACMAADEADRLSDACREYLISLRRYSVGHSASGDLLLIPRRHNLLDSPVTGCTGDDQCKALADYALRLPDALNPVDDTTAPDTHKWTCAVDPTRKGISGTGKSCSETCTTDDDCDSGTVCETGFCVEGAIPPQSCVNAPQRFDLRASAAFAVVGNVSGFVHPIIADGSGDCVVDPNAHPFQVGRIPLNPPACDPAADLRTGLKPDGTYDANPCLTPIDQAELEPKYITGSCTPASPDTVINPGRHTTGIRFHNRGLTFTLVDPTYPGDGACINDRALMPPLQDVPIIPDGYAVSFEITAGFNEAQPAIAPAIPIKVTRGPTGSVWVLDEGDFLSTDLTEATTRGKVFRLESIALSIINLLE